MQLGVIYITRCYHYSMLNCGSKHSKINKPDICHFDNNLGPGSRRRRRRDPRCRECRHCRRRGQLKRSNPIEK